MAATVLDTILTQLNLTPAEYFTRIEQSLEEAKEKRLQKAAQSKELDELVQQEFATPGIAATAILPEEEEVAGEELTPAAALDRAARAKERRAKARLGRPVDDEEIVEAVEPFEDEENQFRLAYRRAMRQGPRRTRDR